MKKLGLLSILFLLFTAEKCKEPIDCGEWLNREKVKARYEAWISVRTDNASAIKELKKLNIDPKADPVYATFITTYNTNVDKLNNVLKKVKAKLKSNNFDETVDKLKGNLLIKDYQDQYASALGALEDLNLQMREYYKNKTGQEMAAFGGIPWESILAELLSSVFKEATKEIAERESQKVDCLVYSKWDEI